MRHSVEEVCLSSGAKGLLIDIPDASVMSYQFSFRAGNRYTRTKDIYETAHLMEHMSFGANTRHKNEHEYEAEFSKNGAYHNAFTGDVSMGYVVECADFEWDRILDLQGLAISEPKFNDEELKSEKGNVLSELNGCQNRYNRLLWPKVQQVLGEDVLLYSQRIKTIANITVDDIIEHHQRTHTAENMRFVIAGKLSDRKPQITKMVEDWKLPRGTRFDIPTDRYRRSKPVLIRRKDANNLTFGWSSILSRKLTDTECDAMDCLNHILTGTMYSKIFGEARKRGLVYDMFSDISNSLHESAWDFGGEVNLDTADELFSIITHEVAKILDGKVEDADMDAAKQYAIGRYQMGAQTVGQIGNHYSGKYFTEGTIDEYEKIPELIKRTSKDDIIRVAREFMTNNIWLLAGVGNCHLAEIKSLHGQLETLYKKER